MGKAFNNDIFGNTDITASINGLTISQEAINENKQQQQKDEYVQDLKQKLKDKNIDVKKIVDEAKEKQQELKEKAFKEDMQNRLINYAKEKEKEQKPQTEEEIKEEYESKKIQPINDIPSNTTYTKKTMIFKQDYLDIIDGLAELNDMQIKDVLNQLLEKSINMLDEKIRDKALKTGKKNKPVKQDKSIF